jgi:hypothetical protein
MWVSRPDDVLETPSNKNSSSIVTPGDGMICRKIY